MVPSRDGHDDLQRCRWQTGRVCFSWYHNGHGVFSFEKNTFMKWTLHIFVEFAANAGVESHRNPSVQYSSGLWAGCTTVAHKSHPLPAVEVAPNSANFWPKWRMGSEFATEFCNVLGMPKNLWGAWSVAAPWEIPCIVFTGESGDKPVCQRL